MQIKAGKYLVGFGQLNVVHPHAWAFVGRPLFQQIYFGHEGFNDIGFNFSFILPTSAFYSNLDLGIFKGDAIGRNEIPDPADQESYYGSPGQKPHLPWPSRHLLLSRRLRQPWCWNQRLVPVLMPISDFNTAGDTTALPVRVIT